MKTNLIDDVELLKELKETAKELLYAAQSRLGGITNAFEGPCGDSFCYASCDMATCRWDLRKGKTPAEHNAAVRALAKLDPNYLAVRLLIKKMENA